MQELNTLRIGDFDVEPSLNRLQNGHEMQTVEPRVMDLLMLLAESPGQVYSRDEILQRVWSETTVQDDALRRVVTLLRRVLDDDPKEPRYIETITRRGYRLVAPVSHPESKPTSSVARATPWLLGGILLLVGLSISIGWLAQRRGAASTQPDLRPLTSLSGHESDPAFSADGSRVAFIHEEDGKSALLVKGIHDGEARQILQRPSLSTPFWSPSGDRLLVVAGGDGCQILSAKVDDPSIVDSLYTCSGGERLASILQPDDETLVFIRRPARFGSPWRVHRYDLVTRESTQLTLPDEPGSGDIFLALSPDRQKVAVIRHLIAQRSKLLILDWATGAQEEIDSFPDHSWRVSWSPDAKSLVFADGTGLYRFDLERGTTQRLISSPRDLRQPSVSPVGHRVAVVDRHLRSNVMRQPNPLAGPSAEPEVIASSTRMDFLPRFGPNEDRLAFISGRTGRSEIWVTRPEGGLDRLFGLDLPNHIHAFLWSPTGDRIAVSDHYARLLIVDVATGESEAVPGSSFNGELLDWSADGSSIYGLEVTDGSPEVWKVRLDDGNRRQITRCGVEAAQESPDGRSLYVTRQHARGLWQVELEGDGRPTLLLENVVWYAWTSSDRGIYSYETAFDQPGIYFRESVVGEPVLALPLPLIKLDFSVSKDHRWLAYTEARFGDGDIILIEG
ncbi:MAG: winged helix-turn-helix domain-containing protein [Thermoanaerobaculia bacterium]|nr:winged helix-turn-helix domain-containing protein [Thermoanaerobaculia bacterium]